MVCFFEHDSVLFEYDSVLFEYDTMLFLRSAVYHHSSPLASLQHTSIISPPLGAAIFTVNKCSAGQ